MSMRVIADHARAATFLIADGVTPSNEWRGYVLRRIMRRAMRHGRMLGLVEPFLWDVTDSVVEVLGRGLSGDQGAHPRVAETVRLEEERFAETPRSRDGEDSRVPDAPTGTRRTRSSDGRFLFTLYDTHGFPNRSRPGGVRGRGLDGDAGEPRTFETEMEAQRVRARSSGSFRAEEGADAGTAELRDDPSQAFDPQRSELRSLTFLGSYLARRRASARGDDGRDIVRRARARPSRSSSTRRRRYAESGGQVGDTGLIASREGRGGSSTRTTAVASSSSIASGSSRARFVRTTRWR